MKIERHSQIIRLISQYDIETQEELAEKLNESGFQVTQATVSRDIRELKLTKISKPGGGSRYAVLQSVDQEMSRKYTDVLRTSFQSMDLAQNILVVKTVIIVRLLMIRVSVTLWKIKGLMWQKLPWISKCLKILILS